MISTKRIYHRKTDAERLQAMLNASDKLLDTQYGINDALRAELQHSRESTGKLINQAAKQIRELEAENERLKAEVAMLKASLTPRFSNTMPTIGPPTAST